MSIPYIQNMIDSYPEIIQALTRNRAQLNDTKDELVAQQTALYAVLSQLVSEHTARLTARGFDLLYLGNNYGHYNLTSWLTAPAAYTATITETDEFTVPGNQTGYFTDGSRLLINDNGAVRNVIVESSAFAAGDTTVTVTPNCLSGAGSGSTGKLSETGSNTSDSILLGYQNEWNFVYDYLTHPLGVTGTYGINPLISSLNESMSLLQSDINKYTSAQTTLARFA